MGKRLKGLKRLQIPINFYEHSNNSYYRYYCIVAIGNNILLPSLSETISDSICTFGNKLAVVSLLGDDSY